MYQMTETEYKFAELIWEKEPIGSGELVKQCGEKFGWKKSTTYTFIILRTNAMRDFQKGEN